MKHCCTLSGHSIRPKESKWKQIKDAIYRLYREIKRIFGKNRESCESLEYLATIRNNPGTYSLFNLFLSNQEAFYKQNFSELVNSIVREKRLIVFETPNRAKITHEYDVSIKSKSLEEQQILFLFLPKKRLSWLKIYIDGRRFVVAESSVVEQTVKEVLKAELQLLAKNTHEDIDEVWKKIWQYSNSIPCFIYKDQSVLRESSIIELEYYDSIHVNSKNWWGYFNLIDERLIEYAYQPDKQRNSWLYVKTPEKFIINVENEPNTGYEVIYNGDDTDPEVVSCTIRPNAQPNDSPIKFQIHIRVPLTLKCWYHTLSCISFLYSLFLVTCIVSWLTACPIMSFLAERNNSVLTVGASIIALIIATRGWLVKEETILKRLLIFLSFMLPCICILLIIYAFLLSDK